MRFITSPRLEYPLFGAIAGAFIGAMLLPTNQVAGALLGSLTGFIMMNYKIKW